LTHLAFPSSFAPLSVNLGRTFLGSPSLFQPRLMGQKLELSTLVVFISLLFWGSLLGLIGMSKKGRNE
jgi:hypothetical protein